MWRQKRADDQTRTAIRAARSAAVYWCSVIFVESSPPLRPCSRLWPSALPATHRRPITRSATPSSLAPLAGPPFPSLPSPLPPVIARPDHPILPPLATLLLPPYPFRCHDPYLETLGNEQPPSKTGSVTRATIILQTWLVDAYPINCRPFSLHLSLSLSPSLASPPLALSLSLSPRLVIFAFLRESCPLCFERRSVTEF